MQRSVSVHAQSDDGFKVPVAGGDEGVPAGGEGEVVAVELVPAHAVAGDFHALHKGFFHEIDLHGCYGGLRFDLYGGQGVGDEAGFIVAVIMGTWTSYSSSTSSNETPPLKSFGPVCD